MEDTSIELTVVAMSTVFKAIDAESFAQQLRSVPHCKISFKDSAVGASPRITALAAAIKAFLFSSFISYSIVVNTEMPLHSFTGITSFVLPHTNASKFPR